MEDPDLTQLSFEVGGEQPNIASVKVSGSLALARELQKGEIVGIRLIDAGRGRAGAGMSTVVQRDRALERANEIRARRCADRRAIRALPSAQARERLGRLIVDCPDWLAGMPVHQLVRWPPGSGEVHAARLLELIGVRDIRCAGDLTSRQRQALAVYLGLSRTAGGE